MPFVCAECLNTVFPHNVPYPTYVEYRDDSYYEFTCEQGHKSCFVLQQQKFELLYQIGAYAILDGYYREAVASFTSSLERFYEFFIKVKLLEEGQSPESVDAIWKTVSSQSERQLGAFIFLYAQSFKSPPPLLHQNNVTFRNSVIHKGKIPTREEALSYGQAVLDVLRPALEKTVQAFPNGVLFSNINHITTSAPNGAGTIFMPTIINVASAKDKSLHKPLTEEVESLKWWRSKWN